MRRPPSTTASIRSTAARTISSASIYQGERRCLDQCTKNEDCRAGRVCLSVHERTARPADLYVGRDVPDGERRPARTVSAHRARSAWTTSAAQYGERAVHELEACNPDSAANGRELRGQPVRDQQLLRGWPAAEARRLFPAADGVPRERERELRGHRARRPDLLGGHGATVTERPVSTVHGRRTRSAAGLAHPAAPRARRDPSRCGPGTFPTLTTDAVPGAERFYIDRFDPPRPGVADVVDQTTPRDRSTSRSRRRQPTATTSTASTRPSSRRSSTESRRRAFTTTAPGHARRRRPSSSTG